MRKQMVVTVVSLLSDLRKSGLRLLTQLLCLAGVAGCGFLGFSLFNAVEERGYGAILIEAFRASGRTLGALIRIDPVYASFVVPFLIVAALSLGGIVMWNRRGN